MDDRAAPFSTAFPSRPVPRPPRGAACVLTIHLSGIARDELARQADEFGWTLVQVAEYLLARQLLRAARRRARRQGREP